MLADELKPSIDRLKREYSPSNLVVIIATTTTGMNNVETASDHTLIDYHDDQEMSSCSSFLANYCGIDGASVAVSTACTSGAKVFGLAQQLIDGGWFDAAIVGASESLCRMTCQGFDSLESYSDGIARPFQSRRDGINIGEGAALFVLEKGASGIIMSGYGESSDAYHESAPDPSGKGAESAILAALASANCSAEDIDYINLHGTGTPLNDAMEAGVISRIFGQKTRVSTTKPAMEHTLGAAGAIEAAVLWLLLKDNDCSKLPVQSLLGDLDPDLPKLNFVATNNAGKVSLTRVLSTSFAFGGHNTALILQRTDAE